MARRPDSEYGFTFTNVEIFRDQELGRGSYGAVYKAKCDSLPCAAKFIYPVLFASNVLQQAAPPQGKERRQPMRRFEAECRFLSQIKHPNIVQYLGVYREPETNVPVLLMELMDESLTHFLESSQIPVLYHIQINILHDTILALAFLHSNEITHRDMSSNNVFLIAGSRAKVTNFGMSTLTDAAASHLASMTQCPGTPAYMSPEALDEPPVYSEKLDCFSFGVLTIQVITREFPKPKDRFQTMELAHPTQPSRRYQTRVLVPELERRQSHIKLIPAAHPLQPIALDCIKDRDAERPTAAQLCETLEQFKSTPLYASSVQQVRDRELQLRTQRQTIEMKEQQLQHQRVIILDKDRQLQDKDRQIQDKDRQIQDKGQQIQDKDRQIQEKGQQIQDKDRQIQDKVRQIQDKGQHTQDNDRQIQDKDRQIWERDQQDVRQQVQLQSMQFKSTPLYASSVQQVRDRELHLRTQRQTIETNGQQLQHQRVLILDKDRQLHDKDRQIQDKDRQIQDKDRQIQDKDRQIQDKGQQTQDKDRQIQVKDRQIWERDQQDVHQQVQLQSMQFKSTPLYASSVQQVRDRELQLRTQRQTIETNEQQLQHQRVIIQDKDRQLQDKDRQIQDKDRQIQDKDQQIQDKDRQIQDKGQQIRDRQIQEIGQQIQDKDRQIQDKGQQTQDKDRQIQVKDRQIWERDQQDVHQQVQLQSMQFKSTPLYASSVQQVRDRELQLRTQRQTIETNEQQLQHQRVIIQDKDRQLQDKDRQIQDKDRQIQDKDQQIQDKDRQIQDKGQQIRDRQIQEIGQQIQDKDRQIPENNQQTQDKDRQIQDKDRQIWERDHQDVRQQVQLQSMQQENQLLRRKMLEVKNQQITELQRGTPQRGQTPRHAQNLQPQLQQLQLSEDQQTEVKKKPASKELTLKWRKGPKAPAVMLRGSSTIIGETVYVNPSFSRDIYAFHCNTTQWSTLPQCPCIDSTLTSINSMLTTVGGKDTTSFWYKTVFTNKVTTHRDHKWVELYPPMPTERCWATVLSTATHVAVMGGLKTSGWISNYSLDITEVMDMRTKQWSTASPLPYRISLASTTLCGEILYLMGGDTRYSILSCRFSDLVQSTQSTSPSTQKRPSSSTVATHSKLWHNIPDLPVWRSTCVTVQGKVLAIGGIDKQMKRTTSIYELNTDNNEWSHKGHMNIARSDCLATALPDNNILVVGGCTGRTGIMYDILLRIGETDETEIATTS